MNLSLLKKLLPGLLPLFVFIIADEIWGTKTGLAVALAFGLAELVFYYIRDRKLDTFILLDTGLLLAMGAVSIALDNDIFFKLKPALIEMILLAIIGFSLWGPNNIVMAMTRRYTGEIILDKAQQRMMRVNMLALFWITAIHILMVLWSAKFMSAGAWAFISGGLFYIFFGVYFSAIWLIAFVKRNRYRGEEIFPVVDEEGRVTGTAPRRVCHDGKSKLLHPVVHLHLFNKKGMIFLQKRAMKKDIQPGKWDTSVGGHIAPGESVETALARETKEEIGLTGLQPQFIHRYIWESDREKELVFSFFCISDNIPEVDRVEVDEGKFWSLNDIDRNMGKGIFTPNFEHEYALLRDRFAAF